jgi:hypothetical protein
VPANPSANPASKAAHNKTMPFLPSKTFGSDRVVIRRQRFLHGWI